MKNSFSLKVTMKLDYDIDTSYIKDLKKKAAPVFFLVFFIFLVDILLNFNVVIKTIDDVGFMWWLLYIFLITLSAYTTYQSYLITSFLFKINKYTKQLYIHLIKIFFYLLIELIGIIFLILIPLKVISYFFILFFIVNILSFAYFIFSIYRISLKREKERELYVPFVEKKQKKIKI
jgi:hypothetical protein